MLIIGKQEKIVLEFRYMFIKSSVFFADVISF